MRWASTNARSPGLPSDTTPTRRGRRPGGSPDALTKDRILTAALGLLDANGLAAFSVRDLAKALDVYPASIYWHVRSRNQLLADMVARVLRDIGPKTEHLRWQDWLRDLFTRYRTAVRCHPQIAPLIGAQLVSNASIDFDLIERMLAVLGQAGFEGAGLVEAFSVVTAAQVGFVTLEFAPVPQEGGEQWSAEMRALIHSADPQHHPLLAAHLGQMANRSFTLRWENGATAPMDRAFALYVDTVIAGLEHIAADAKH